MAGRRNEAIASSEFCARHFGPLASHDLADYPDHMIDRLPTITIAARGQSVVLRPQQPHGDWFRTFIEITAGPFHGVFEDDVSYTTWRPWRDELVNLHKSLAGEASFASDGRLGIIFRGDGLGHVTVQVTAIPCFHDPSVQLKFDFVLDQTYLPPIIEALAFSPDFSSTRMDPT